MKNTFLLISVSAFLFAGCSGNSSKEHDHSDGTHQHSDGENHQHSDTVHPRQIEFNVDSSKVEDAHDHSHDHDHKH